MALALAELGGCGSFGGCMQPKESWAKNPLKKVTGWPLLAGHLTNSNKKPGVLKPSQKTHGFWTEKGARIFFIAKQDHLVWLCLLLEVGSGLHMVQSLPRKNKRGREGKIEHVHGPSFSEAFQKPWWKVLIRISEKFFDPKKRWHICWVYENFHWFDWVATKRSLDFSNPTLIWEAPRKCWIFRYNLTWRKRAQHDGCFIYVGIFHPTLCFQCVRFYGNLLWDADESIAHNVFKRSVFF